MILIIMYFPLLITVKHFTVPLNFIQPLMPTQEFSMCCESHCDVHCWCTDIFPMQLRGVILNQKTYLSFILFLCFQCSSRCYCQIFTTSQELNNAEHNFHHVMTNSLLYVSELLKPNLHVVQHVLYKLVNVRISKASHTRFQQIVKTQKVPRNLCSLCSEEHQYIRE